VSPAAPAAGGPSNRAEAPAACPRHARRTATLRRGCCMERAQAPRAAAAHISTSVMGWIACARRTSAGATSDSPRYFTLPSSTIACAAALRQARPGSCRALQTTHMLMQSMCRTRTVQKLTRRSGHGPAALTEHWHGRTWHGCLLCSREAPVRARLHALHDLLERRVGLGAVRAEDEDVDVVGLEEQAMRFQHGQERLKAVCWHTH